MPARGHRLLTIQPSGGTIQMNRFIFMRDKAYNSSLSTVNPAKLAVVRRKKASALAVHCGVLNERYPPRLHAANTDVVARARRFTFAARSDHVARAVLLSAEEGSAALDAF